MAEQYWAIQRTGFGLGGPYIFKGSEEEAKKEAAKKTKELGFEFIADEVEPYFSGWKYKHGDEKKGYTVDMTPSQG